MMGGGIAFLFPGQGSQVVGMGRDLAEKYPEAREVFSTVDEICGRSVSSLCFEGPLDALTVTDTLQPAVIAVDLAILSLIRARGINARVSAGHSVGECAALASAGVLDFADALKLARKRGELMHREATAHPGGMAAVVGLDIEAVRRIVDEAQEYGVLDVGNHNAAEQIVITGEMEPLGRAVSLVKHSGARAVPLKVSGAWHSRLMAGGITELREFMEGIAFHTPSSPMVFNATAETESDPEKIKDIMAGQLAGPVRWYESIRRIQADGIITWVEVGPKNVLTSLVRKILTAHSNASFYNVHDVPSLESFLSEIG